MNESNENLTRGSLGEVEHGPGQSCDPGLADNESLRTVYEEVCNSYHAIDDFRMKLIGLLPLTSIVGLVFLEKDSFASAKVVSGNGLVAYAGFFAAAFTLALFVYEIRGIRRSHGLVERGKVLEEKLHVPGQFLVCAEEAQKTDDPRRRVARLFNSKTAACFMYALVFAAWLFVGCRYGLGWDKSTCAFFALVFAVTVAAGAYRVVAPLIPA